VWIGLGIAYFSVYPAGFFIATVSAVIYALARTLVWLLGRRRLPGPERRPDAAQPSGVVA
jgi:hypothetical protein